MHQRIYDILPNTDDLLALEPEELAGVVLEYLNSLPENMSGELNRHNFHQRDTVRGYSQECQPEVLQALMEAWVWLEREGLIAPDPEQGDNWVFVTRRGQKMNQRSDLDAYRKADLLPRKQLHHAIAQKVWATFLRGDYDTAVFQAFKEVEVAVRQAGNFGAGDYGVQLMTNAFKPGGPLADQNAISAEQEAFRSLFAGAVGCYKNPHSHRNISIADPTEAMELIVFASHLLRIVDSRRPV